MHPSGDYDLLTIILMMVLALWGGLVNYITRIKRGAVERFSLVELLGEWVISGFSGVMVYLLCTNFAVPNLMAAVMVGIAGHAGGRTVFVLERLFNRQLDSMTNRMSGNKTGGE